MHNTDNLRYLVIFEYRIKPVHEEGGKAANELGKKICEDVD